LSGYFGKKSDMFVHHLAEMKPEYCIHPVKKEDKTYFTPDTLQMLKAKGLFHVSTAAESSPHESVPTLLNRHLKNADVKIILYVSCCGS